MGFQKQGQCSARIAAMFVVACVALSVNVNANEDSGSSLGVIRVADPKRCPPIGGISPSKRKAFMERLQLQCKKHKASSFFCENLQLLLSLTTQGTKCNNIPVEDDERIGTEEQDDFEFATPTLEESVRRLERVRRDAPGLKGDDGTEGAGDGSLEEDPEGRALNQKIDPSEDPSSDKDPVHMKKIDRTYNNLKTVLDWMMGLQPCDASNANDESCKSEEGRELNQWKDTIRYYVHSGVDVARDVFMDLSPVVQHTLQTSRSYDDIWSAAANTARRWLLDTAESGRSEMSNINETITKKIQTLDHRMDNALNWVLHKGSEYLEDEKISRDKWFNNLNVVVNWAMRKGKSFLERMETGRENDASVENVFDAATKALVSLLPRSIADALLPEQQNKGEVEEVAESRGKGGIGLGKGKGKKGYGYFAAILGMKAIFIKWGIIMAIKALAFKALVVSSVALTLAIAVAAKKLGGGGGGHHHSKVVVTTHGGSGSGHEYDDAWESSSQGGPGPGGSDSWSSGTDGASWSTGGGGNSWGGGHGGGWNAGWQPSGGGWSSGGGGGWNNGGGGGGWNNAGGGGGGWGGGGGGGGGKWNRNAVVYNGPRPKYSPQIPADTDLHRTGQAPIVAEEAPVTR